MIYKKIKVKRKIDKIKAHICLIFVLTSLILSITLPCVVRANQQNKNMKGNMFYVQLLNYTMPVVKVTSFDESDMAENTFSVKGKALDIFGIDIKDPSTILGKEVSYLKANSYYKKSKEKINLEPYKLDNKVVSIYNPNLKRKNKSAVPEVFIYHSHTTEAYKPGPADNFDENKNVCAVGDIIASELNNYGVNVIHDKTVHNAKAYTKSYERSGKTVDKYLKDYKDFKLVIDLHRDGATNKNAVTTKINGENVAKFMFVMAKKNPHFNKNMEVVKELKEISNKLYPGLCKDKICYYNYGTRFFNQDKSNNACLIEVGADINTIEEAKATGKYLGRIIAEYLNGKK
ncbi:stage II sporulation protein SpoIIP [Clostridium acetireducens DSM 10703]|uniref:Stage II sporulation protein SpoIIP n=1 Tax=Clostridium acetireducens DSM 10703 TaxID=1121290 RepID=A0A1E8F183_9CLOT|nr:stage II sporulation protein SpoIIP [Clostridium acetireducens DSM 10703]